MNRQSFDWSALTWILVICIATSIVYGSGLGYYFSQDDFVFLARASRIASWGDLFQSFLAADHFYRPVPRVGLFVTLFRLFGLNPGAFHAVSLGLHSLNAVLLFLLCRRIFSRRTLAGVCGLLYACHHVPFLAVYWVSGIQELSATCLLLLSLHLHLQSAEARRPVSRILSVVAFGLALLSKEVAVVFPALLLLTGLVRARSRGEPVEWKSLTVQVLGYGSLVGLYLVLRSQKAATFIPTEGPYTWSSDPSVVLANLRTHVSDALYVREWLGTAPMRVAAVWAAVLGMLVITAMRSPPSRWIIAFGAGWFLVSLLPALFLSERSYSYYAYLPLAGMVMVLAAPVDAAIVRIRKDLSARPLPRAAMWAGFAVLLTVWLWFSATQVRSTEIKDPAGIISKSRLAETAAVEIRELYPALPEDSTLYVTGLTVHQAWAFGLGDLFRLIYPQTDVVLVLEGEELPAQLADGDASFVYDFGGKE